MIEPPRNGSIKLQPGGLWFIDLHPIEVNVPDVGLQEHISVLSRGSSSELFSARRFGSIIHHVLFIILE